MNILLGLLLVTFSFGGTGGSSAAQDTSNLRLVITPANIQLHPGEQVQFKVYWQSIAAPCDLNFDGTVDAVDVGIAVQQASGQAECGNSDLDLSGSCTIIGVQRVIATVVGGGCDLTPKFLPVSQ
jgi:hypothetical protein